MDTVLTTAEREYLASCRRGCLATIGPDGGPDVVPVSYRLNADGTIDIGGLRLGATRKFRNLDANPNVAFVVDDLASVQPWRVRCVEIRGRAEALPATAAVVLRHGHPQRDPEQDRDRHDHGEQGPVAPPPEDKRKL